MSLKCLAEREKEEKGKRGEREKTKKEFKEVCRMRLLTPELRFQTSDHKALPVLQELPFLTIFLALSLSFSDMLCTLV